MSHDLIVVNRHRCKRKHRSYRAIAKCLWPNAVWVHMDGPYASVAYCRETTVELHATEEGARRALEFIDHYGCGGACSRDHALARLVKDGS